MPVQDFAKFVASQQESTQNLAESTQDSINGVKVDWDEIRREWLKNLDNLYSRIAGFLQEFEANGSIRHIFEEVTLNEENLGSYRAKSMEINIGRQHISLEPIGTLFVGFKGRVDVIGSTGRAQLLLVNENAKSAADLIGVTVTIGAKRGTLSTSPHPAKQPISWAWKIVSRGIRVGFVELNKESFFELLMEVAGA